MPVIPPVGRRSWKIRLLEATIYGVLALLGSAMVYPFLITLTASVAGPVDYDRFEQFPKSIFSREERFVSGLPRFFPDGMRNGMAMFALAFDGVSPEWTTWKAVGEDRENAAKFARSYLNKAKDPDEFAKVRRQAADFDAFASRYPLSDSICTFDEQLIGPFFQRCYRAIAAQSGEPTEERALAIMSRDWGIPLSTFYSFRAEREFQAPWDQTSFVPFSDGRARSFEWLWQAYRDREFLPESVKRKSRIANYPSAADAVAKTSPGAKLSATAMPPAQRDRWKNYTEGIVPMCETRPYPMKLAWLRYLGADATRLRLGIGGGGSITIEEFNRAFGTSYETLHEIPFPIEVPPPSKAKPRSKLESTYVDFAVNESPRRMNEIRPSPELDSGYRNFVRKRLHDKLDRFNDLTRRNYESWDQLELAPRIPATSEPEARLWMEFVGGLPFETRTFHSAEGAYQRFLLERYGDVRAVNEAYGWRLTSIRQAEMPVDSAYLVTFVENERPLHLAAMARNYRFVFDYLFHRERAVWNTIVLIVLSLAAVLTVNPLAAYALSRFRLRQTHAIILFLLATMAFPVAVSMIPAFLLMRDLHLLNTYAALILPGLANGFSIFLLKGFFDSLPSELYEAATIDGAKEWQMFMKITRPLSMPILAVIALGTFMGTYAAWEWAIIVCQKPSMWTVSVWLYRFTSDWGSQPWLVMASFVIASVPVFLVFLLCQNVILRGIILPQMK